MKFTMNYSDQCVDNLFRLIFWMNFESLDSRILVNIQWILCFCLTVEKEFDEMLAWYSNGMKCHYEKEHKQYWEIRFFKENVRCGHGLFGIFHVIENNPNVNTFFLWKSTQNGYIYFIVGRSLFHEQLFNCGWMDATILCRFQLTARTTDC